MRHRVPRPDCVPTASRDAVPTPLTTASCVPPFKGDADAVVVGPLPDALHTRDCVPRPGGRR
jgi:hypothetical protein